MKISLANYDRDFVDRYGWGLSPKNPKVAQNYERKIITDQPHVYSEIPTIMPSPPQTPPKPTDQFMGIPKHIVNQMTTKDQHRQNIDFSF